MPGQHGRGIALIEYDEMNNPKRIQFAEEAGNLNPDLQTYKYNGKEFDTMLHFSS